MLRGSTVPDRTGAEREGRVTEDSTATGPFGEDPDEDTPAEDQDDTAENTPDAQPDDEPPIDSPRYRELQATFTRSQEALKQESALRREREDEILRLRAQAQPQYDPNDPLAERERRLSEREAELAREAEWASVRTRYPPEVIEAYQEASRNWQLDPSPLGAINGFIQGTRFLAERALAQQQGQAPEPSGAPTRREAVKPRVDTSRSEAPIPGAIEKEIAGAQERGDTAGVVAGLFKRAAAAASRR